MFKLRPEIEFEKLKNYEFEKHHFYKRDGTSDESWLYGYDESYIEIFKDRELIVVTDSVSSGVVSNVVLAKFEELIKDNLIERRGKF